MVTILKYYLFMQLEVGLTLNEVRTVAGTQKFALKAFAGDFVKSTIEKLVGHCSTHT